MDNTAKYFSFIFIFLIGAVFGYFLATPIDLCVLKGVDCVEGNQ